MRRAPIVILAVALLVGAAGVWSTQPRRLEAFDIAAEGIGDAVRGERLFWTGGCVSCHAAPKSEGEAALRLGGGAPLVARFGTFHAPNISSDPVDGIGAWTLADFADALQRGVARNGSPLYPAFPYTAYARMTKEDVADLFAFLKTLPPVAGAAPANELSFPFDIRRGVGLWQRVFLDPTPVATLPPDASDAARRGRYLVEGPGHCGECHTPRLLGGLGGLDRTKWLAGAPAADGPGHVPDITPTQDGIGAWSQSDIAYYLETGFTPDFDSVGGTMVEVQQNMAKLPAEDREAIAAYLKALPGS